MEKVDIPLDFRLNNSVERGGTEEREKGREEESRKRGSTFSLDFSTIGPAVPGGSTRKVIPCAKSFQ